MRASDLLRSADLFARLPLEEIEQVGRRMQERQLAPGDVLCRQGEQAELLFVVADGCVELAAQGADGRPQSARQLTSGESFGEVALFANEPYSMTATALTDGAALVLPKHEFEAMVATQPRLMRAMLAVVSRRAVQTNRDLVDDTQASASNANGRIYPIFSTRGGAGKTTLAVHVALHLAELLPGDVALLDLDLLFDDAALLLNVEPGRPLANLPESDLGRLDARSLRPYLAEHSSSLQVAVAATRPEEGERVSGTLVRAVVTALKREFAITIVDCDSTLAEPQLVALESAERVIVVCTPELHALRDVRDVQRVLGQALRLDRKRIRYWLNHPLPVNGLSRLQFESALEQQMNVELPHVGDLMAPNGRPPAFRKAIQRAVEDLGPLPTKTSTGQLREGAAVASASPGPRLLRLLHGHG